MFSFFVFFSPFVLSSITYNSDTQIFTLNTKASTYQIFIGPFNYLIHLYYGERISDESDYLNKYFVNGFDTYPYESQGSGKSLSLNEIFQEYPSFGSGDYRIPCISALNSNGSSSVVLKYKSHEIKNKIKKPKIPQMPHATADEIDLLDIELHDDFLNATVHLFYSVFEDTDVITRYSTITNNSPNEEETITLTRAMSACLDIRDSELDISTFYGRHKSERNLERSPLKHGKIVIDSIRGASSPQQNPFVIISDRNTNERYGTAIGISLIYSGNFAIEAEVDQTDQTRITIGINPNQFNFKVDAGQTFYTPEAVFCFSSNGFGNMSRKLHRFVSDHVIQSKWKNKRRPILINNWEATFYKFDDDKIMEIAQAASELGIELFVLDDGWFGHRDSHDSSLGDWYVYENKIKRGLNQLTKDINKLGMYFGLWFEPEMISEDSDLFRAHPEYAMRIPGRKPSLTRNQLILDFTNPNVVDNIFDQMQLIINNSNITYIKWDMNRHISDLYAYELSPSQTGEIFHRYILGVYSLLERITTTFPDLLIEGCSGGGGRFDLGMLYYSPQFWASDTTDPIGRLKIQFGTSYAYPVSSMGSHVSVSPSQQTLRVTSFKTRAIVAMAGTFGYELDVSKLSEEDRKSVVEHIQFYQKHYDLINHGDLYRLISPFDSHHFCAWMSVSQDKNEALLTIVKIMIRPSEPLFILKLDGLDPNKTYTIEKLYKDRKISGDALMRAGIIVPSDNGDFNAFQFYVKAV
ncbi:Alpha-galactosidase 1 [Tritrichomonas foetus]|uniref:alpha-galactosidase n=1 Tax=Tritrichomonas foetus TaxID=1144522 RepID=A0A1J4JLM4_9EUKA|nr:Alpha-galactosidase 1 [Tritrichomonas foetus]|eukprot:OHS98172.1 Alpha-galactosidase 1 [Tritrichomonas foetus]